MILKDFKIDETHLNEVVISAEVIIRREGKWWAVPFKMMFERRKETKGFITTEVGHLQYYIDSVKHSLEQMERLNKHYKVIHGNHLVDGNGHTLETKEFVFS